MPTAGRAPTRSVGRNVAITREANRGEGGSEPLTDYALTSLLSVFDSQLFALSSSHGSSSRQHSNRRKKRHIGLKPAAQARENQPMRRISASQFAWVRHTK